MSAPGALQTCLREAAWARACVTRPPPGPASPGNPRRPGATEPDGTEHESMTSGKSWGTVALGTSQHLRLAWVAAGPGGSPCVCPIGAKTEETPT